MIGIAIGAFFAIACGASAAEGGGVDHETEARPILEKHCFKCHGPDVARPKGGLSFRNRDSLLSGGELGPAIAPGDARSSRLMRAVRWEDDELQMPPKQRLDPAEITILERWIDAGAPWSENAPDSAPSDPGIDLRAAREWWSFREVVRPPVPTVSGVRETGNPIDAFVAARLVDADLAPAPEADRRTLARRLWLTLLGVPPSFAEIEAFVADTRSDAYERLVDALLARPEYGERWGRHWLDVVRYAESSGFERDQPKLFAWRYRDWVVAAFNDDLPFDRFVKEQIAGDELDDATTSSRIATGFYRLGPWDSEPDDPALAYYDERDDLVRTISEGFLGVTIGCARCHDHKFDPFAQSDYYGLLAFVRNVRSAGEPALDLDSSSHRPLEATREQIERWRAEHAAAKAEVTARIEAHRAETRSRAIRRRFANNDVIRKVLDTPESTRTDEQRQIASKLDALEFTEVELRDADGVERSQRLRWLNLERDRLAQSFEGSLQWSLVVLEEGPRVPSTHVLVRGSPGSPGDEVPPRFPLALCADDAAAQPTIPVVTDGPSSRRRRVLAEWIASPRNPLTARVIANRVWHHLFGRGIVATPNDFGSAGDPPRHAALLDWLASELVEHGWSLKHLQRLILTSATWRQASSVSDPEAERIDPENRLLWRQNRKRLEAEAIRDSMLVVSGELNPARGGPSFFEPLDRSVLAGSSRPGEGWGVSPPAETLRRTIYSYAKRNLAAPFLEVFDLPNSCLSSPARFATTVPTQSLTSFNGAFTGRQARALAARIEREAGEESTAQVRRVFELVLQRAPTAAEEKIARDYLASAATGFADVAPEVAFEARIPSRVDFDFLACLEGKDRLAAPPEFEVAPGRFGNEYNKTREVDPIHGPAALLRNASVGDGELSVRWRSRSDAPFASLLVRSSIVDDLVVGVEVRFDSSGSRILLHSATESRELASVPRIVSFAEWDDVRVAVNGSRIEVASGASAERWLCASDDAIPAGGSFGIRTWGAGVAVQRFEWTDPGQTIGARIEAATPRQRALEAFALIMLNSSEFVSVD